MAQNVKVRKIRTRYDFIVGKSNPGNGKDINEYGYKFDDENVKVLVVKGKKSLYEKIQLHKDDTNIYNILDRYFKGDVGVLDKNKGIYCDVSMLPDNIVDLNNKMLEQQELFSKLPIDIKKMYGNSLGRFSKAVNDNKFVEDMVKNEDVFNKYLKKDLSKLDFKNDLKNIDVKSDEKEVKVNGKEGE